MIDYFHLCVRMCVCLCLCACPSPQGTVWLLSPVCHVACVHSARQDDITSATTCGSVPHPQLMDPWPDTTPTLQTSATSE